MFGNKRKKVRRLESIGELLDRHPNGLTQAELARKLGVSRGTINKDLAVLQERTGILVCEDERGILQRFRGRR